MRDTPENENLLETKGSYGTTENNDNGEDVHQTMDIHSIKQGGGLRNSIGLSFHRSVSKLRESMVPFPASIRSMGGTSSMSNEMFNLTKNLIGAGAFGIPSGIAAFAGSSTSNSIMIPAAVIILIMAAIFGYYFILIGRLCKMTGAASYREIWDKSAGVRSPIWEKASFLVPLSVILMAGLGNLAYSMILADTTRSLMARFGIDVTRTASLISVTVFVLLPLCMVKKLSVLAPFSAVGTGGILFTIFVIGLRYFDGTYDPERSGGFLASTSPDLQPSFIPDEPMPPLGTNTLLLACMCFQAFFCHYNAPRYYTELRRNTIPRFSAVVNISFGISALAYFILGIFGYYTFGEHTDGFILNNYSAKDDLASICRFAIAIALAFTYPLPFIGTRDGILDLFSISIAWQTSTNLNILTVVILFVFTVLAWHFTDLGLVNAIGGAALGTAVVFIFPSIMFYSAVKNLGNKACFALRLESVLVILLMLFGIAMGTIGVIVNI